MPSLKHVPPLPSELFSHPSSYLPKTFSLSFAYSLQHSNTDMALESSLLYHTLSLEHFIICIDENIIHVGDSQLSGSNSNLFLRFQTHIANCLLFDVTSQMPDRCLKPQTPSQRTFLTNNLK